MSLEQNTRALLDLVERDRENRCRAAREEARETGDTLLREARHKARQRVQAAVREARSQAGDELRAARAALETRRRQMLRQRDQQFLQALWSRLEAALIARWHDPGARSRWLEAVLTTALDRLPRGPATPWRVRHPPDWPADESARWQRRLRELSDSPADAPRLPDAGSARLQPDPALRAGLILIAGGATLDASPAGLMDDKAYIEARALTLLREASDAANPPDRGAVPAAGAPRP